MRSVSGRMLDCDHLKRQSCEDPYRILFESSRDAIMTLAPPSRLFTSGNPAALRIFGVKDEKEFISHGPESLSPETQPDGRPTAKKMTEVMETALREGTCLFEWTHRRLNGELFLASVLLTRMELGGQPVLQATMRDITEEKQAERERELTIEFLQLMNTTAGTRELIETGTRFFGRHSGCEAVGIRLRDGDDYPYFEFTGFSQDFIEKENSLCSRDEEGRLRYDVAGNPLLECMCGNVISGRTDPAQPFFTPSGSFWTNSTSELLAATTEADRQGRTRNRCHHEGYESVALIALSGGGRRLGLIQLNDRRRDRFTPELIALWERLAGYLAAALAQSLAKEALHTSEARCARVAQHMDRVNRIQQELLGRGALDEKLKKITEGIVNILGAECCRIWIGFTDGSRTSECSHARMQEGPYTCQYRDDCLHPSPGSEPETAAIPETCACLRLACDAGCDAMCGQNRLVSCQQRKFLTNEAATDTRIPHRHEVKHLGLTTFARYQLRPPGGETIGVLSLFSRHPITPDDDALLDSLANTATQVILCARAEDDQRRLEAQLAQAQRLESVGRLASGVAHEINTPTQFVSDNTRFLQQILPRLESVLTLNARLLETARAGALPEEILDEAEAVVKKAKVDYLLRQIPEAISDSLDGLERITNIVRAMKDFSHPDLHEMRIADLNKAIESTVTVARNEWKYVSEMVLELDPELPPVHCALSDINQVLLNLIINSAHAIADVVGDGAHEKGTITISTRKDGNDVEIRIRDTGTGIPEEHRRNVFDHFFTTRAVGQGTGQGLAIAHSVIVDKHGGSIDFVSEMGAGTTFIIRLPIDRQEDHPTPVAEYAAAIQA